jgi:hypothetical protein
MSGGTTGSTTGSTSVTELVEVPDVVYSSTFFFNS